MKTMKKTGLNDKVEQKQDVQKQSKEQIQKNMMIEIVETFQQFIKADG